MITIPNRYKENIHLKITQGKLYQALHFLYRALGPTLQEKAAKSLSSEDMPLVFMHGNPHLDNFVRTPTGCGMIDFDRARMGPYALDLVRFLGSLLIYSGRSKLSDVPTSVIEALWGGYRYGFNNPHMQSPVPLFLSEVDHDHTSKYVKYKFPKKKWKKKISREFDLQSRDYFLRLLNLYFESRDEQFLQERFKLEKLGKSEGSFGKAHYIFYLKSSDENMMIDVCETYDEPDNQWCKNPFSHNGRRMLEGAFLYAQGVESRLAAFSLEGKHFWARQIPTFTLKVRSNLPVDYERELCFSVGMQLGIGHSRWLGKNQDVSLSKNFGQDIIKITAVVDEIHFFLADYFKSFM